MWKVEDVLHEMLVLRLQHLSSWVCGFPVPSLGMREAASPILFQGVKASCNVVRAAGVAFRDIPTGLQKYWRSFCVTGDTFHTSHSTLYTPHFFTSDFPLPTLRFTLHTLHFTPPSPAFHSLVLRLQGKNSQDCSNYCSTRLSYVNTFGFVGCTLCLLHLFRGLLFPALPFNIPSTTHEHVGSCSPHCFSASSGPYIHKSMWWSCWKFLCVLAGGHRLPTGMPFHECNCPYQPTNVNRPPFRLS